MCLFCDIIEGKIPSTKVYENEFVYCFDDIKPAAPVHTLVVPKKHFDDIRDMANSEEGAKYYEELKKKYAFTPENAEAILQKEVGEVFKTVLEHAGVFKRDAAGQEAFLRFAESVK